MSENTTLIAPARTNGNPFSAGIVLTDPSELTGAQKAAIILQVMLSEGGSLELSKLGADAQKQIAQNFAAIRHVDQSVLDAVVADFEASLDKGGLPFAHDMVGRFSALNNVIASEPLTELRDMFGISGDVSPWDEVAALPAPILKDVISNEAPRIASIILSKLSPGQASSLLESLPNETANTISYAINDTGNVPPATVDMIGMTLAKTLRSPKQGAFAIDPVGRMAAILNAAGATARDEVLAALGELDEAFATCVRAAIFTFEDIPARIKVEDIPKITRVVSNEDLVPALVHGNVNAEDTTKYILENMSKRMADQLRDEMQELGAVAEKAGEAAQSQLTAAIRELEEQGEITLMLEIDQAEE